MQNETIPIETVYSLRQEQNGLTLYNKKIHRFCFYEGLTLEDVKDACPSLKASEVRVFFQQKEDCISQNIHVEDPIYIGWQLSENCNMDCIYCFADDKLHGGTTKNIINVAKSIMNVHPVCVGLSGGEPTLDPHLPEIIRLFEGKISCILNTNGTTPMLKELVPLLKEAGSLVRISLDSTNNEIQNYQRPLKSNRSLTCDQASILRNSVEMLLEAGVPLEIHTVVTQRNREFLEQTATDLISWGVRRWHLYHVEKCPKNKDFYDELEVSADGIRAVDVMMREKFGDSLDITAANASVKRTKAVLLVDSLGRFLVKDSSAGEIFYIGKNPYAPTVEELHQVMNWDAHQMCYYINYAKNKVKSPV